MLPDGTYAMVMQPTDHTDCWCASFYAEKAENARKQQAKEEAKRRVRHATKHGSKGLVSISPFGGLQTLEGPARLTTHAILAFVSVARAARLWGLAALEPSTCIAGMESVWLT